MSERGVRWATPLPSGRGDRIRTLLLPAILVLVASLGIYRHVILDQSSWRGASFGMFATYDNRASRTIVVHVREPAGERRVVLPSDLRDDAGRLAVVPTASAARNLAGKVLELADDADAVRVEVWRLELSDDPDGLRVATSVITSVEVLR